MCVCERAVCYYESMCLLALREKCEREEGGVKQAGAELR